MSGALLAILLVILALLLLALLVMTSFALTLFFGSPFVPTHPYRAKRMLEFASFVPGETLLDLGSGDGAILLCAVQDFGAAKAIGYEINPLLVTWARIRAHLRRIADKVTSHRKNIFNEPLPQVDVVSTFLIPSTMKRLHHKLATELHPDTRIISRGFKIPGATPIRKQEGPEVWLYLYRAGDLKEQLKK